MRKLHILRALLAVLPLCAGCAHAQNTTTQNTNTPVTVDPWTQLRAPYDYDAKQPLGEKLVNRQETLAAVAKRLTIRGARGATVPLYIVLPSEASAQTKVPGVVLLHGKGGRAEDMLIVAQYLATRGYASLIPEIVGHGARRVPDSAAQMFGGDPKVLREGFIESVQDVRRALDLFVAQPEVDAQRIGLVGISLGAIMGSITTAVEPRIATAILIVGGADWRTILQQSQEKDAQQRRAAGAVPQSDLTILEAIDPKNFAAHITPRPVLMINGRQDAIIPEAAARALFEAAREPKQQLWFDYGHSIPPTVAAVPMQQWLDDKLKSAAKAASVLPQGSSKGNTATKSAAGRSAAIHVPTT